jgi:hypothetical protein
VPATYSENKVQNASILTNFLSGVLNSQTAKLPGDLQEAEYLFVAGFQFREEFLLLQTECDLLVGSQNRVKNREDAAQRLKSSSRNSQF